MALTIAIMESKVVPFASSVMAWTLFAITFYYENIMVSLHVDQEVGLSIRVYII